MQKTPTEIISIPAVDFAQELDTGDSLVGGNVTVTSVNLKTGGTSTSTIVVSGSTAVAGTTVTARVQAGALGDLHRITLSTGLTTQSKRYERIVTLEIVSIPEIDRLLVDLPAVKDRLNLTDTSEDATVLFLLKAASAYVRNRTKRQFTLESVEEVIDLECPASEIRLGDFPVVAVTKIELVEFDGTVATSITDTSFYKWRIDEKAGWVIFTDGTLFYSTPGYNRITALRGYAEVPDDIKEFVMRFISLFYRGIGLEGLESEKIGDYAYKMKDPGDLPANVKMELLDPWMEGVLKRHTAHDF